MINDPKSSHFISWTELGTRSALLILLSSSPCTHLLSELTASSSQMSGSLAGQYWARISSTTTFEFTLCSSRRTCALTCRFSHPVFEFCAPAEHVRVPQDQSGGSIIGCPLPRGWCAYVAPLLDTACAAHLCGGADLGVLPSQIPARAP